MLNELPKIIDMLCEPCRVHFESFSNNARRTRHQVHNHAEIGAGTRLLHAYGIRDYRITAGSPEHDSGRGRYDGLSEMLGGRPMKGFGFRVRNRADGPEHTRNEREPWSNCVPAVYIAYIAAKRRGGIRLRLRDGSRAAGVSLVVDLEGRKLKKLSRSPTVSAVDSP